MLNSLDEGQLKIAHDQDVPVEYGEASVTSKLFNEAQQLDVGLLVLCFHETEKSWQPVVVLDRRVEDVELRIAAQNTLECPIGMDDIRSSQAFDGLIVAKDEEIFSVIFEKMMFFGLDDFVQIVIFSIFRFRAMLMARLSMACLDAFSACLPVSIGCSQA